MDPGMDNGNDTHVDIFHSACFPLRCFINYIQLDVQKSTRQTGIYFHFSHRIQET